MKKLTSSSEITEAKEKCLEAAIWARCQLLQEQPFIGSVAMHLAIVPVCDDRLRTAATDGNSIFLDCQYFLSLPPPQQIYVIAHQVWHLVFLHVLRQKGRDQERWDVACDLEVQFAMESAKFMSAPWSIPYKWDWRGLPAEEIFERIKRKAKRPDKADQHLSPDTKPQDNEATASSDPRSDPDFQPEFNKDLEGNLQTLVLTTAQQMERSGRSIPDTVKTLISRMLTPRLNWKMLLAQYLSKLCYGRYRWFPPSRRHLHQGLYLPSITREKRLQAVIAIDTSGSTEEFLPAFLGEFAAIIRTFGHFTVTLIQCDDEIRNVATYTDRLPALSEMGKLKGGGGTDFCPVFRYVGKHPELKPDVLVYFTDGYGTAPDKQPAYPVLWVLTPDSEIPATWGQSILMLKND